MSTFNGVTSNSLLHKPPGSGGFVQLCHRRNRCRQCGSSTVPNISRSFGLLVLFVLLPFCPAGALSRADFFAGSRRHRFSFSGQNSFRSSVPASQVAQGCQSGVQPLHFSLRSIPLRFQLLHYPTQIRHGSPSGRNCTSPTERRLSLSRPKVGIFRQQLFEATESLVHPRSERTIRSDDQGSLHKTWSPWRRSGAHSGACIRSRHTSE